MIEFDEIRKVLECFEGKGLRKGYVPCKNGVPLGVSGVTIGTGVDLGQQSRDALANYGISSALVDKLMPYVGLKKEDAIAALKLQPLVLSEAEVEELDNKVITEYIRAAARAYDVCKPARSFNQIPAQAQAVIVSMLYQRGRGYLKKIQKLWNDLKAGEWDSAADWLVDPAHGDGYHSRRRAEGELLRSIGTSWFDKIMEKFNQKGV